MSQDNKGLSDVSLPLSTPNLPNGYWEVMTLPPISAFQDNNDVLAAWWKIISHYLIGKQYRVVPKSFTITGEKVDVLIAEAVFIRNHGIYKTVPLLVLEYKGPECLPLDGPGQKWTASLSRFHGVLDNVLQRQDLEHIYVGLAVGEYVKFWKVDLSDGGKEFWGPMTDLTGEPAIVAENDTLGNYDITDWYDKQKVHGLMSEITQFANSFYAHPKWRAE